jgi:hypothetical protein
VRVVIDCRASKKHNLEEALEKEKDDRKSL